MKRIFFIYWIWHICILIVQIIDFNMSFVVAKSFACFSFTSLFYISIVPFVHSTTAIKGTSKDLKWMYACIATIATRWTIQIVGIAFGYDIYYILAFDLFTILVYFGINWKLSRFSNSKWLSMYGIENE